MKISPILLLALAAACGGATASAPPTPPTPPAPPTFIPTSFDVKVSGAGRPVILIPGLACDGSVWDGTVAHLGGKFQTHVISLAGFGGKPALAQPLLPTVHDELVRYIRDNHLDHPIVVGHSLGGFMVFWLAETNGDLLGGAVAVDGAPYLAALRDPSATPESVAPEAKGFIDKMFRQSPDAFAPAIDRFMSQAVTSKEDAARIGAAASKSDPNTTADAMLFLFTHDLRPDLGKIPVPVLMIAADTNGGAPREALEKTWHAQIDPVPHHELVVIEHSKHFVMQDQPVAFYAALDGFLKMTAK